jgi:hypothetical protein
VPPGTLTERGHATTWCARWRHARAVRSGDSQALRDQQRSTIRVSLAAIVGLAAARIGRRGVLRNLSSKAPRTPARRGLGARREHDGGSIDVLGPRLPKRRSRLAGDAAWALGDPRDQPE